MLSSMRLRDKMLPGRAKSAASSAYSRRESVIGESAPASVAVFSDVLSVTKPLVSVFCWFEWLYSVTSFIVLTVLAYLCEFVYRWIISLKIIKIERG